MSAKLLSPFKACLAIPVHWKLIMTSPVNSKRRWSFPFYFQPFWIHESKEVGVRSALISFMIETVFFSSLIKPVPFIFFRVFGGKVSIFLNLNLLKAYSSNTGFAFTSSKRNPIPLLNSALKRTEQSKHLTSMTHSFEVFFYHRKSFNVVGMTERTRYSSFIT